MQQTNPTDLVSSVRCATQDHVSRCKVAFTLIFLLFIYSYFFRVDVFIIFITFNLTCARARILARAVVFYRYH